MLIIIDNTLTAIDHTLPSKEELHLFCQLLFTIGVDIIELSTAIYQKMEYLPENGKYFLHINSTDDMPIIEMSRNEMSRYDMSRNEMAGNDISNNDTIIIDKANRKEIKRSGICGFVSRNTVLEDRVIPEIQINDPRELMKLKLLRGSKELRIVGLDGILCYSYEKILKELKNMLPGSSIQFCPENHYHCASALAVLWLTDYGNKITSSFAGHKNNAATEEVIMSMRLAVRRKPNSDLTVLPKLSKLYEKFTGRTIDSKKPILGKKIFHVEAGIHADGIMKNPATYEAFEPGCVGQKSVLVIGKHSGSKAIKMKLQQLNLPVPDDDKIIMILNKVKMVSMGNRSSISDREFVKIVREVLADEGKKIHC